MNILMVVLLAGQKVVKRRTWNGKEGLSSFTTLDFFHLHLYISKLIMHIKRTLQNISLASLYFEINGAHKKNIFPFHKIISVWIPNNLQIFDVLYMSSHKYCIFCSVTLLSTIQQLSGDFIQLSFTIFVVNSFFILLLIL